MPNRPPESEQLSEEARLLKEGHQWIRSVVSLATQTSKLRVWVPLLCSAIMTGYYLYNTIHKNRAGDEFPPPAAQPSAVAAVEETAIPEAHPTAGKQVPQTGAAEADANDSCIEIRKKAGEAHAAQQFGEEAKLWEQFMERSPLPQEACPAIGKAYERAGDMDASVHAFEQCVSFDAGNEDVLSAFAHVLQTKRDFNGAAALYHKVLFRDPKNLDAQTGLALVELKQNHLQDADAAVTNILHKDPNNTDALLIAGIVAWRQERIPDAEKIFRKGVGLDDRREDFHAFLGRIAEAEGHPQDALQQYERALALDPSDSEIVERQQRLKGAHE